ncbi:transmembrane protein 160 isoform X2 [Rhinatrema bivittatum]|uniref:transmembrane protein 160 isoform X2 n=1 Tax=Rhinatrema bivittatum TaxID=194408 RepID=UPI001127F03D|nr:transmembrane protein 160 isoform X2 [Rhinatrema bivittatum]
MAFGGWWRAALGRVSGAGLYFQWRWRLRPVGSSFWRGSSHGPVGSRGSSQPGGASSPITELDKADAWLLRKAHETGFFILGGICVSYGSASYLASLFLLRRTMMLSLAVATFNAAAVLAVALFWLCAISLYIGRLEVEIVQDDEPEDGNSGENGKSEK